jgi:hypothetical protein
MEAVIGSSVGWRAGSPLSAKCIVLGRDAGPRVCARTQVTMSLLQDSTRLSPHRPDTCGWVAGVGAAWRAHGACRAGLPGAFSTALLPGRVRWRLCARPGSDAPVPRLRAPAST